MMTQNPNDYILIIEDSKADFLNIEIALKSAEFSAPIVHFDNGDEALDFLLREGAYKSRDDVNPIMTFLDINLPGEDGVEILTRARATRTLRRMPIIVLTTSYDEVLINKCYETGANSYIAKPAEIDSFIAAMKLIREYWFKLSNLPRCKG